VGRNKQPVFQTEKQKGRDVGSFKKANAIGAPLTNSQSIVSVGRNAPCPCGSKKKFKKCCGRIQQ